MTPTKPLFNTLLNPKFTFSWSSKNLFPKDKIKNWKSEENYCEFNLQNAYTLEILKESVTENIVFLKSDLG